MASRQPEDVACRVVTTSADLDDLAEALRASEARAIDVETVYVDGPMQALGAGALRVVSVATSVAPAAARDPATAWVVDVNGVDRHHLALALSGVAADGWNAGFDARVIERDLIEPAGAAGHDVEPPRWWDAQLADALLHQGLSGFTFYHGLAWASEWYLGIRAEGKGTTQLSYRADGDLSAEQVRYAAADAVETLWVAGELRRRLRAAGLEAVCRLEQRARPFLDHMERAGLPFDWEGWKRELTSMERQRDATLGRLAELTGGGQGVLFSEHVEPTWNPGSDQQVKAALNTHATEAVLARSERVSGQRRMLQPTDSLTAADLADIGGELCTQLLAYRDLSKTLNTYGEGIREHLGPDGRIHPEYLQVVGTNTGRLASRNPNAQNLTPKMKPHFRPVSEERVFVHADLSQAELRMLAQVSGDRALRQAFADGVDVHEVTAEAMFSVDMAALAGSDPDRHHELRSTAKRINFGIVYGQRGPGLARSLRQAGVETSDDEGRRLLDAYLDVYPEVAHWVAERDRFIEELSDSRPEMDWSLTLQLHRWFRLVARVRRDLRELRRRWPTAEEVCETLADREGLSVADTAWTLSFHAPVALTASGGAFTFASHTPAGRRQQFTMHTESLLLTAATTAIRSTKPGPAEVRRALNGRTGPSLARGPEMPEVEIRKLLEDRSLRRLVVDEVTATMGPEATAHLLDGAMGARIAQMANAYRNAPIQGGVADIMLDAYGLLADRLARHPGALGVQTVHDSVAVECDRPDAEAVAKTVKEAMEEAMGRWCPDVPPVADTDVRTSLADRDIVFRLD